MTGTIDSFSRGKKCSFLCKTFSLFLPCNMTAVQNLYSDFVQQVKAHSSQINEGEKTTIRMKKRKEKKRQKYLTMGCKILDPDIVPALLAWKTGELPFELVPQVSLNHLQEFSTITASEPPPDRLRPSTRICVSQIKTSIRSANERCL